MCDDALSANEEAEIVYIGVSGVQQVNPSSAVLHRVHQRIDARDQDNGGETGGNRHIGKKPAPVIYVIFQVFLLPYDKMNQQI